MAEFNKRVGSVSKVVSRIGKCLELIPMDPHFKDISVGLYEKDNIFTVWTYSQIEGVDDRIAQIRDQLVKLGGVASVDGSHNQFWLPCKFAHNRALRFLLSLAVERPSDYTLDEGQIRIKDTKSPVMLNAVAKKVEGKWLYEISAEGEEKYVRIRQRASTAGFVRYGEMIKINDSEVKFPCDKRHDELVRIILPYSRNVSQVEDSLEADSMRGQMTTDTLGFSQT